MDRPQCPLDKIKFGREFRSIDAFPTNVLGKDLLEIENLWSKCSTHDNEAKKFICLTDNTLVCGNCVMFGEHEGHDVRLLTDFLGQAKDKKGELEGLSSKMSKSLQKLNSSLEEKYRNMKDLIKQRFEKVRAAIAQQERAIILKLDDAFLEEKARIDKILKNSSDLSRKIQDQLNVFSEIRSNPNIMKLVQEDFSDLKKTVDERIIHTEIEQLKELSEISSLLQSALPKEDFFKCTDIIRTLDQEFDSYKKKRASEQFQDFIEVSELIITQNKETGALHIQTSSIKNSYTFKKSELGQVSQVSYNLKLKGEMHMNLILPSILTLSKYLTNLKSIKINLESDSKSMNFENAFYNLVLASFCRPENLKRISINATNLIIKDAGALHLFNNVIPKIKDLEKFSCKLGKTQVTASVLRSIPNAGFSDMPNLKTFKLDLSETLVYEQDAIDFLLKVPNVEKLSLRFERTSLSNKAVEKFSTDALPGLNKVASLKVGFSGTKITDLAVQKFMANLPSVSNLEILLNGLILTDASLQSFFENKLPTLTNKPNLKIEVESTLVSAEFKKKFGILSNLPPSQHQTKPVFNIGTLFSNKLDFLNLPHESEQQPASKFGSSLFSNFALETTTTLTTRPAKQRAFI